MGILNFLRGLLDKQEKVEEKIDNVNEVQSLHIDEEDRLVVALAASAMAGKDKPDSYFHITKIKRVK